MSKYKYGIECQHMSPKKKMSTYILHQKKYRFAKKVKMLLPPLRISKTPDNIHWEREPGRSAIWDLHHKIKKLTEN